jgi:nucleotide-binding universal stress UspA family protein
MIEIRRILCPMDFSATSRHALEHAVAVGRWYGSHITAVHVISPAFVPGPPIVFTGFPGPMPADVDRSAIEAKLREWLQPATEAGLQTDILLVDGNPAPRILECATSLPADLIVVGTHGLGGVERFLLGSVAERVLRKAPCPVLTVPPRSTSKAKLPYKRLLCPVDFSDPSLAAFQFVVSLAKVSDAHLTILHVFDWPPHDEPLFERFDTPEFRRLVEGEARGRLEALVTDDLRTWCTPATKIGYGKPYRQILEVAEAERSDLIVIGVQGRNALDLTMFGSTTNHVVRRASCPVLTLRR